MAIRAIPTTNKTRKGVSAAPPRRTNVQGRPPKTARATLHARTVISSVRYVREVGFVAKLAKSFGCVGFPEVLATFATAKSDSCCSKDAWHLPRESSAPPFWWDFRPAKLFDGRIRLQYQVESECLCPMARYLVFGHWCLVIGHSTVGFELKRAQARFPVRFLLDSRSWPCREN